MANQQRPRAQTPVPVRGGAGQPGYQAPRQRILRIGVLLGGKIVEERLIRERTPVTIGQSMKNNFSIPVEGLPLEFTLFAIEEGKYYLRFLSKMDGRLSDGTATVNTLDALKQRGATNVGDYWSVALSDTSRGKLSLGDLTVLFQFVTEPPRQPKPMLPASVRGTFADRFDPRLTVIMSISIIAHMGFLIYFLFFADPDEPESIARAAYNLSFHPETIEAPEEKKPDETPTEKGSDAGSAAAEKKPDPTPVKKPDGGEKKPDNNPTPTGDGGRTKDQDVALKEAEAARAAADALAAAGDKGQTEGDMSSRRPGATLNQQIADVKESGREVKVGGGTGGGSRTGGDPKLGTGGGPKTGGTGGIESGTPAKTDTAPGGRISVSSKGGGDDIMSPQAILDKVTKVYITAIQRCYKEYLKKDATAHGTVTLALTVSETGRGGGSANGVAPEVSSCITNLMGGWNFPVPKDKDGEPSEANFKISLALTPN